MDDAKRRMAEALHRVTMRIVRRRLDDLDDRMDDYDDLISEVIHLLNRVIRLHKGNDDGDCWQDPTFLRASAWAYRRAHAEGEVFFVCRYMGTYVNVTQRMMDTMGIAPTDIIDFYAADD